MRRLLTSVLLLAACEGSDPPGDRAIPYRGPDPGGELTIGAHEGAEFWSLRADSLYGRRGAIELSFGTQPPEATPCAAGWVDLSIPCYPAVGLADGWRNAYQVVAHEVGHVAGLGHSDDPRNIMHERLRLSSTRTTYEQEAAVWLLTYTLEACRLEP